MSGENYRPWNIDINAFPKQASLKDQLYFLLNFAVLAPSSHNSQPWRFSVSENAISVFVESSRRLPQSDVNDRQLYISLGCAITNIAVAADYYGFSSTINYFPSPSDENLAAKIIFAKGAPKIHEKNHLIFSIPKRTNNRNKYENRLPDESFFGRVRALTTEEIRIDFISDEQRKNQLTDIAIAAGVKAMASEGFRQELSKYVKTNITRSKIGMPAFGMGIPTPVSLIVPAMIKRFNMNRLNVKKDEQLLKIFTPIFVIISVKDDNKLSWLNAGELYERIALLAIQSGLSTAVWAAPIQIGEFYKEFQKVLETNFRPQVFFRLGYAKKSSPHSPRLSASEVIG